MKNGPYILVKAPEGYPGKKYRGLYIYEHHLVWWEGTGTVVGQGFVLHHKNHIKTDNRLKNLEIMPTSKHSAEHSGLKGRAYKKFKCRVCGIDFLRSPRKINKGSVNQYCSRACGGKSRLGR